MVAVSRVGETTAVSRGLPFHSTVLPEIKLLPVIVKVKSAPPAGVEAGENEPATGTGLRLLLPAMLLVNRTTALLSVAGAASARRANPFAPQRTSCVPV